MKRLVSAILILLMLFGCAFPDSSPKDYLSLMYWMYSMNHDVEDKYLDTTVMYLLLHYELMLSETLGMLETPGREDEYKEIYDGLIEDIGLVCDIRRAYTGGFMTKEVYTEKLFEIVGTIAEPLK